MMNNWPDLNTDEFRYAFLELQASASFAIGFLEGIGKKDSLACKRLSNSIQHLIDALPEEDEEDPQLPHEVFPNE